MAKPAYVTDLPEEERHDPGDKGLRKQVIDYEKIANPKELRRMRREGTLEDYVAIKIRATRNYARYLIGFKVPSSEAWRRAIRVHILERDED